MRKTVYIAAGVLLVVAGIIIAPLPGPGGVPVIMAGMLILLRHSPSMRRRWVRTRRRWPRAASPFDRVLRRMRGKRGATPNSGPAE